jgi:hypothetical protein
MGGGLGDGANDRSEWVVDWGMGQMTGVDGWWRGECQHDGDDDELPARPQVGRHTQEEVQEASGS